MLRSNHRLQHPHRHRRTALPRPLLWSVAVGLALASGWEEYTCRPAALGAGGHDAAGAGGPALAVPLSAGEGYTRADLLLHRRREA